MKYYQENKFPYVVWKDGQRLSMPRYYKEQLYDEETLREMGREALKKVVPSCLNATKRHQINQENLKQKILEHEKRGTI